MLPDALLQIGVVPGLSIVGPVKQIGGVFARIPDRHGGSWLALITVHRITPVPKEKVCLKPSETRLDSCITPLLPRALYCGKRQEYGLLEGLTPRLSVRTDGDLVRVCAQARFRRTALYAGVTRTPFLQSLRLRPAQ